MKILCDRCKNAHDTKRPAQFFYMFGEKWPKKLRARCDEHRVILLVDKWATSWTMISEEEYVVVQVMES